MTGSPWSNSLQAFFLRRKADGHRTRRKGWSGRRRLKIESLERRILLASDMGLISGTVFSDLTSDGRTADDPLLSGVTIRLFRDGGDNVFGGDDTLVGTQVTDESGRYSFAGLAAGRYFVEQSVPNGFMARPGASVATVDISAEAAEGTFGLTIDSFESAQTATAASNTSSTGGSTLEDAAVLGGERDLRVRLLSGMGVVSLDSDFVGMGVLQFSSSGSAVGEAEVVWDGPDANASVINATGLGGVDLTTADGNPMSAFLLHAGADQAGAQITIQVFTSAGNSSQAVLEIPATAGSAEEPFCVLFSDFTTVAGTGADFTNVGAIRMVISSGGPGADVQVALTGTVGVTPFEVDFANFEPLSIGDLVWNDANNNGLFDAEIESGIAGVTLNLYEDTDGSGDLDPASDTLITTTTTDEAGGYLFEDLFPGTYIVQIPPSEFEPGGPLFGMVSSTGNDPTPDPNDNVNNDDNGMHVEGLGVVSRPLSIATDAGPIDDGDSDPNSNLTLDFGFFLSGETDLEVTKTTSPDPAIAGEELTYTIVVTNQGGSAAAGVVLTDTLPAEVMFVSATSTQGEPPVQEEAVVTAELGTIEAGESATVTIIVSIAGNFGGTLTNTATATGNETDVNPDNNTVTLDTTVELRTDLAITKADDTDEIVPGQTLTYTLEVTNLGPSDASGVVVTDTLPAGVTFVSATTTQGGEPSVADGVVTAELGDLAAGATATVTIQVTIDSATTGTIENTATVTSATPDPDLENNTAVQLTLVTPEVDLAISKSDSPDPVTAGEPLTYTLTVTNNGPADATNVIVTDTLPAGVTFSTATASQGEPPTEMDGVVTAILGTLPAGASATVTIVVDVGVNTFGTITNMASVTADEPETDPENNTVSETTEVRILPASLSGFVFVDFAGDGVFDGRDVPIPGVTLTLTGMDITGASVTRTTVTDINGRYAFENLPPGTYRIEQTQPRFFPTGTESIGTAGGTARENVFEMIELMGGVDGLNYNFGERVPTFSKRQFLASSARRD